MSKEEEHAVKVKAFILKLAQDTSRGRNEIQSAIVAQLESVEDNPYFPEIVYDISPANYSRDTKHLGKREKALLDSSLEAYSKRKRR